MCGLAGILLGDKTRSKSELARLGETFTRLLVLSEERGSHATGAAWMNADGEYGLFKRPLPASQFVGSALYDQLLAGMDSRATVLMGHTRWRTRGDEQNNANNHPIQAGFVLGTHNGTILNADDLFRRLRYPRAAEVDSEILCRIVNAATRDGSLNLPYLRTRLALCHGQMSAVFVSRQMPDSVLVLKGDNPLSIWAHARRQVVAYASDGAYLEEALDGERGWTEMTVPPMTMLVFRRGNVCRAAAGAFGFIQQTFRGAVSV